MRRHLLGQKIWLVGPWDRITLLPLRATLVFVGKSSTTSLLSGRSMRVFGSADHSEADRTSDRGEAAQE